MENQKNPSVLINLLLQLIPAVIGGLIAGYFALQGVKDHFKQIKEEQTELRSEYAKHIEGEIEYNKDKIPFTRHDLRGALEMVRQNDTIYLYVPPIKTITYDRATFELSDIYKRDKVNFLFNLYERLKYINSKVENFNLEFSKSSVNFGTDISKIKMKESLEILINHCLTAEVEIQRYRKGKFLWGEEYQNDLKEWKALYWLTLYDPDNIITFQMKSLKHKDSIGTN
ncbi:MAG: hypothetical protein HQ568_10330 [Calditrichaeota bacterium]|nr:hypothetical protein [Calditrichota bacterium]